MKTAITKLTFPIPDYYRAKFHGPQRCPARDRVQILRASSETKLISCIDVEITCVEAVHL